MGSFVPPLYYGFYCSRILKIVYMSVICSLGIMCIIVSLWSKFNTPKYRLLRAGKSYFECVIIFSEICAKHGKILLLVASTSHLMLVTSASTPHFCNGYRAILNIDLTFLIRWFHFGSMSASGHCPPTPPLTQH